ncbi:MAG: elongation factor G [Actinobacteria bacterium]|nr:elongation factor G [Actinomycetota bacterium]
MAALSDIQRIRNIGIIAHIDAGKTTTTERILYYTGRIHRVGEVHDGTTQMDWMAQERERGITIVAAATTCDWLDHQVNIIDTPGHVDFTAEVERSLRVLDGGVVVFDAVNGVEPQSETVWRQADKYRVPRIAFVNKMDRLGASYLGTVAAIRNRLQANPIALQVPIGAEQAFSGVVDLVSLQALIYPADNAPAAPTVGPLPEELAGEVAAAREHLLEALAVVDDHLAHKYLEGAAITTDEIVAAIRTATVASKVVPVLMGTALRNKGIEPLLDAVVRYLPSPLDMPPVQGVHPETKAVAERRPSLDEPFAALAFKIVTDPHAGKVAYFRVYSGAVEPGATVLNATTGKRERLNRVLRMHADKREEVKDPIRTGDILAAVGMREVATGHTLTVASAPILLESIKFPEPVVTIAIEPKSRGDQDRIIDALLKLGDEDPTFRVSNNQETGQTLIAGMGELHLEVLVDRLLREFRVQANIGRPEVSYRERPRKAVTVRGRFVRQSGGRGQYGDVTIELEPRAQGAGIEVATRIRGGAIPINYLPAVERGLRRGLTTGVHGYPVTDVQVVAIDGSYHEVDSSELAFEQAGALAIAEALKASGTDVMQPIMSVQVVVPEEFMGEVLGGLAAKHAAIHATDIRGGTHCVSAEVPLAAMFGYANDLRSVTQGRGTFSMEFSHYAVSHGVGAAGGVLAQV